MVSFSADAFRFAADFNLGWPQIVLSVGVIILRLLLSKRPPQREAMPQGAFHR